jgi:hypothetical protein
VQPQGVLGASTPHEALAAIVYCGLTAATGTCLACAQWVVSLVPAAPVRYCAYLAYPGLYFRVPLLTDFLEQSGRLETPPS